MAMKRIIKVVVERETMEIEEVKSSQEIGEGRQ